MTDRASAILPEVSFDATPSTPHNALAWSPQAQYMEVKDKAPAPQQKIETGDAMFNQVLSIKSTEGGQGFADAQAAAKAFVGVADKGQALEQGKPAFEAAIQKSDQEYVSTIAKFAPDYNVARRDVIVAMGTAMEAKEGLQGAFGKVPEDKKEDVKNMIALLGSETSPGLKAALRKDLSQYPGLVQNFDVTHKAFDGVAAAEKNMVHAAQPMVKAARDEAATRYIYAHALELGGDTGRAVILKQEGQDKMNQAAIDYLGAPKPPAKSLKV